MSHQHDVQSQALSDDIYNATPQHTGATQGGASNSHPENVQELASTTRPENPFEDGEGMRPALPPRRPFSPTGQSPPLHPLQSVKYHRSKEHIMAYMIPLPQPVDPNGQPVEVPQRYMLYLPPAPDLLKPPASSETKERKRDKCVRRWQAEVRKAKTHNGSVVSLSGLYSATVRGAVYCLSLVQRSELTFLSRLPRKTLQDLCFVHPAAEGLAENRRFELLRDEFKRNKHIAKRDFWIGAVVLPFAQGVDIAIPVGGGFSEVTLAWMIITGSAWKTARGMLQRLVFHNEGVGMGSLDGMVGDITDGSEYPVEKTNESPNDGDGPGAANADPEEGQPLRRKNAKAKPKKPPVETTFHPSDSLDELLHYIQAACHERNPGAFPDVGKPGTEAGVLTSIGWAPEDREVEDKEGDVAWQIRKTTDDLRLVVMKAAKTWDKFCMMYVQDPEKALRDEEKARVKSLKREEKERLKSLKRAEEERAKSTRPAEKSTSPA